MAGLRESSYVTVDDPRDFYHNVVVVLDCAKDVNNGQPSALASCLHLPCCAQEHNQREDS
jgi:hypothetical protein